MSALEGRFALCCDHEYFSVYFVRFQRTVSSHHNHLYEPTSSAYTHVRRFLSFVFSLFMLISCWKSPRIIFGVLFFSLNAYQSCFSFY